MVNVVFTEMKKLLGGFYVGDYIPWLAWVHRVSGVDVAVDKRNKVLDKFMNEVLEEHEYSLSLIPKMAVMMMIKRTLWMFLYEIIFERASSKLASKIFTSR